MNWEAYDAEDCKWLPVKLLNQVEVSVLPLKVLAFHMCYHESDSFSVVYWETDSTLSIVPNSCLRRRERTDDTDDTSDDYSSCEDGSDDEACDKTTDYIDVRKYIANLQIGLLDDCFGLFYSWFLLHDTSVNLITNFVITIHITIYLSQLPTNLTVLLSNPSQNPSTSTSGNPSGSPLENPSRNPSVRPSQNSNPSVRPSPTSNPSQSPLENPSSNPSHQFSLTTDYQHLSWHNDKIDEYYLQDTYTVVDRVEISFHSAAKKRV